MTKFSSTHPRKPYTGVQPGILHKLLFQVIQCLHHICNLQEPSSNKTSLPKAFLKKQDEWTRFIRPAQASRSQFQEHYRGHPKNRPGPSRTDQNRREPTGNRRELTGTDGKRTGTDQKRTGTDQKKIKITFGNELNMSRETL